ncbi:MAG: hypothetical protein LBB89_07835 [Treponema sp.]|nr:hypothetical protein [Treponema sp.]
MLAAVYIFPQDEVIQRGSIPEELLRPRRDEAPRYPIDTVIGAIGQGQASTEAYAIARRTAAALLAGNMNVSVLSSVNKAFLEDCMTKLKSINPQSFRLGSGREEPDGSSSFLVRFVGREEGITGELFVRLEERRPKPEPPPPVKEADINPADSESADFQSTDLQPADIQSENGNNAAAQATQAAAEPAAQAAEPVPAAPINISAERVWFFEDLILEEPRSREAENRESRHRFDFSPYERFY